MSHTQFNFFSPRWSALIAGLALFAPLGAVDIVVTASRIEEDSSTVPAVVTVIDEEDLEDEATVLTALEKVPEVNVSYTIAGRQSVSMGGFGEDGFLRTLVLVDGVPMNRPDLASFNWESIPLDKVERIEVVQGGASVLYGDQAVAGVINIITREEDSSGVTLKTGIDSRLSRKQSLSGNYRKGDFSLFGSISRTDTESDRDGAGYSQASVTITPSLRKERFSFSSELYYRPDQYDMPGGLTEAQFKDDPDRASNTGDSYEGVSYGANTHTSLELGDLQLDIPLTVYRQDSSTDMASWFSYYDSLLTDVKFRPQGSYEIWSGNSLFRPVGGIDGKYTSIAVERFASPARETETMEADVSRFTLSPWFVIRFSHEDRIMAEAGARYYFTRLNAEFDDDASPDGKKDTAPLAYNGSLTWLPAEGVKTFINYNYLFKLPALDKQVFYSGFGADGIKDLDPERGHSVTSGIELSRKWGKLSFAPYYIYMFDEIYYDGAANRNGAETSRLGASLNGSFRVGSLELGTGYSYVNASYASGDNRGKQITLVSPHKLTGSVKIILPEGFTLAADGTWNSSYYQGGDEANSQEQIDGRNNLGLRAGWTSPFGLSLSAYVDNLLDGRTPSYVYYDTWTDLSSYYPTEGRVFGVQAAWTY